MDELSTEAYRQQRAAQRERLRNLAESLGVEFAARKWANLDPEFVLTELQQHRLEREFCDEHDLDIPLNG